MSLMNDLGFYRRHFRHLPILHTERLILRPIRRSDAKAMYEYTRDKEVARYVLWDPHRSLMDTCETISEMKRQYRHGWPCSFAIALAGSDQIIGTIGYMWLNTENCSAEIGYSLSRKYWNQGYMTEALKAVLDFSFNTLELHRIEAQHDIRNPASGQVMKKNGMIQEGILRDRLHNKGQYCTIAIYSIINPKDQN